MKLSKADKVFSRFVLVLVGSTTIYVVGYMNGSFPVLGADLRVVGLFMFLLSLSLLLVGINFFTEDEG